MRCAAHGLAVGPDGECVLCRRDRRAATHSGKRAAAWLGGMLVLVAGLLAVARLARTEVEPASSQAAERPPAPTAELVALRPASSAYEPGHTPMAAIATTPARTEGSANVPTPPDAAAAQPPPTQAELQRALRATPVMMYTTAWCPVCRRARQYFSQQGIAYRERDIDTSEEAHQELARRTGRTSVPTIEVDGVLLRPGFSEAEIGRALIASLERRLGVRGLELRRVD